MGRGTEINKIYTKRFRIKFYQKLSKSAIDVRDERKRDVVYHEAMNIYMEDYKNSKGKSARACCQ